MVQEIMMHLESRHGSRTCKRPGSDTETNYMIVPDMYPGRDRYDPFTGADQQRGTLKYGNVHPKDT